VPIVGFFCGANMKREKMKVVNWEKWQTYRSDRGTPPWIKVHRNLLTNLEWSLLTDAEKGQLVSIWLVAADKKGVIPADANILRKFCQLDSKPNIKKFTELGFIGQLDNHLTPKSPSNDAPETETETETDYCAFDDFWEIWPKKKDKSKAEKVWNKLKVDNETFIRIKNAVEKSKTTEDWTKQGGKFIPYPTTYLNGRRWEDEHDIEVTKDCDKCKYKVVDKMSCWQEGRKDCGSFISIHGG
jgi:hypothetical protein